MSFVAVTLPTHFGVLEGVVVVVGLAVVLVDGFVVGLLPVVLVSPLKSIPFPVNLRRCVHP